jgi:hypothetical protein
MWIRVGFIRRRVTVLSSVVPLIVACCALVASGGAATVGTAAINAPAGPGVTGTWGDAEPVPGIPRSPVPEFNASVNSVSCSGVGDCSAGGAYGDESTGEKAFVMDETGGNLGRRHGG